MVVDQSSPGLGIFQGHAFSLTHNILFSETDRSNITAIFAIFSAVIRTGVLAVCECLDVKLVKLR